jgi:ribosomal protein L3 glutamine methyltransferase
MELETLPPISPEDCQEAIQELATVRDLLRWAMTQCERHEAFYGHGTDNPWDEAQALVLPCLELDPVLNPDLLDARLTRSERERIVETICLRVNDNMPVAYIHSQAYFCEMPFYVDERVIIPRSPIGELIQQRFEPWLKREPKAILDLCTGSGCIAIACAIQFESAEVDAVDISLDALEVAAMNVEVYDLEERVHLLHSDLFESVPLKKYDLIISNPPYVSSSTMELLPEEYLNEPELALRAGEDGLSCALPILAQAAGYLSEEGILILEVGESEQALEAALADRELPLQWLTFEQGGEGVCLVHARDLRKAFSHN